MNATATRTMSTEAEVAACIRQDLKHLFPSVKFNVRKRAGGSSITVEWTDGPTVKMVNTVVSDYESGHFDGMIDMYVYSNNRRDLPQVRYVHTNRHTSQELFVEAVEYVNRHYSGFALAVDPQYNNCVTRESDKHVPNGNGWQSGEVWRLLESRSMICTNPNCQAPVQLPDHFCGECGTSLTGN